MERGCRGKEGITEQEVAAAVGWGERGSESKGRSEEEVAQGVSRTASKTWAFLAHTRKGLFWREESCSKWIWLCNSMTIFFNE